MRFGAALWAVSALASAALAAKDEGSKDGKKWEARGIMTNQLLQMEVVSAACETCCTYTYYNFTVHSTLWSTETIHEFTTLVATVTEHDTVTATVTEHDTVTDHATVTRHDVSTKLEYTTQFVTTTTTSTFATSFPVTVTSVRNCSPRSKRQLNDPDAYDLERLAEPDTHHCETVTRTEWRTTTTTEAVTVVTPSVTTKTVVVPTISVVPTTVEETRTLTQVRTSPTTVWVPTTFTKTTTVSTEYPVTITSDHTVVTTSISTEYITTVSTYTSSYPVVTQITKLITQTATVTAPGQLTTLTLPGETKTLPGSTVVSTITNNLPGTTEIVTTTVVLPPTTVIVPPGTVTVTPIFNVTLCPSPTGSSAPLPTDSDLTFGCKPGYVCNPQKPQGCNFWPEPPSKDFLCNPQDCIRSPPYTKVDWRKNETEYYPPSYGYFNLDPEAFGLSYDIFDYNVCEEVKDGHTVTITTGNWASQTSLSEWPRHTSVPAPPSYGNVRRGLHAFGKRDITPSLCFDDCNNALLYAESVGKTDALCKAGSQFQQGYSDCAACILNNTAATKLTIRDYVQPQFAQFLDYCNGKQAVSTSSVPAGPESEVLTLPTLGTSAQAGTSQAQFTPVVPTPAASSSNAVGSTNPSQSANTEPSAAGASSAAQGSSGAAKSPTGGADSPTKGTTGVTTQATALPAAGSKSGSAVSGGQQSATGGNGAGSGSSPSAGGGGLPGSGSKTAPHASGQTTNPAVVNGTASTSQPVVITAAAPRLAAGGTLMMISLPILAAFFA